MLIIPLQNAEAFTSLGSAIEGSFGLGEASFEIGEVNTSGHITGVDISNEGFGMAWMGSDAGGKYLAFMFDDKDNPENPIKQVIYNSTSSEFFRDIGVFADGTTWDIVTQFQDNGNGTIAHFRSIDNGATWGSINVGFNGTSDFAGGGYIDTVWSDVKGDVITNVHRFGENVVYTAPFQQITSTDGGATWTSPVQLGLDPDYFSDYTQTHIDDQNNNIIHTTWLNSTSTPNELWYTRSTDSGATFSSPTVLSGGSGAVLSYNWVYQILSDGNDVTILYEKNGNGLSQVRSNDNGATWTSQEDVFDNSVCNWTLYDGDSSTIRQDGKSIVVVCSGVSGNDLYHATSTDMGATWGSLSSVMSNIGSDSLDKFSGEGSVVIDGSNIYVYSECQNINGDSLFCHTFVNSNDTGTTWSAEERVANVGQDNGTLLTALGKVWLALDQVLGGTNNIGFHYGQLATPDTTSPVITLLGDNPQEIDHNEAYVEAGATCSDDIDGDISGSVVIGGSVDTGTVGQYFVTYDCQDTATNDATQEIRTVNVNEVVVVSSGGGGSSAITSGGIGAGVAPQPVFTTLTGLQLVSGTEVMFSNADITTIGGQETTGFLDIGWNGNNDLIIESIDAGEFDSWFEFIGEEQPNSVFSAITLKAEEEALRQQTSLEYVLSPPKNADPIQYNIPITLQGKDSIGNNFTIETVLVVDLGYIFADPVAVFAFIVAIVFLSVMGIITYRKRQFKRKRRKSGKRGSFANQLDSLNKF
jgi:hypothetical protein